MKKNIHISKILLFIFLISFGFLEAAEKDINNEWCIANGGITEYRTKDGTYVDCLTDTYAIEVEYDYNWKESIGQSLHYAETTGKQPAILFIKRKSSKKDYFQELKRTVVEFKLPIKIFIISD